MLLHGALQAFARMAEALGGLDDAAWARRWQARIEGLLTPLFWRPEGRFLFGVRRTDKEPVLGYTTTTFANGYAILFGLTTADQTRAILDFMGRQEFVVPGPYHIPPDPGRRPAAEPARRLLQRRLRLGARHHAVGDPRLLRPRTNRPGHHVPA